MTREQFNQLPNEVKDKATNILKAYDKVYIDYENGEYKVSVGIALTTTYAPDHKVIGTINKEDIFTEDEMMINYMESFHEYPANYKGKRDYQMLNSIERKWDTKFKMVDGNIVIA